MRLCGLQAKLRCRTASRTVAAATPNAVAVFLCPLEPLLPPPPVFDGAAEHSQSRPTAAELAVPTGSGICRDLLPIMLATTTTLKC